MAYKLLKPYTQEQKNSFIVQYSHNMGMIIGEISTALCALEKWETIEDDEIVSHKEEWNREQFEIAKANKKQEALDKAYEYEQVGVFPYEAEVIGKEEKEIVHIEFKPDNLTKFQGFVLGYMTETITGKVTWLSAEDIAIYCTQEDCVAILQLIAEKDSKLWETDYVRYLKMIDECLTKEGVESIIIDYEADNAEE